jgi:hypothetical protein
MTSGVIGGAKIQLGAKGVLTVNVGYTVDNFGLGREKLR